MSTVQEFLGGGGFKVESTIATPQTPRQIEQQGETSSLSVSPQDFLGGGSFQVETIEPVQQQQIIQQGIQEPEQRIVPAKPVETLSDANILTRAIAGVGNIFGLGQAADIAARTITEGGNEELKNEIINKTNQQISTYQRLIQNAQERNNIARVNRLTADLANNIQRVNDMLGEDIFSAPTALQQAGAALTTAAAVVPALKGGLLFAAPGKSLLARGVPLAVEGAGFFSGLRAAETGEIGETLKGAGLGAGLGLATPAALRGVGVVGRKTLGPFIRGLERPQEVETKILRPVARFLAPVSNIIKSTGKKGLELWEKLENIRIDRDLFVGKSESAIENLNRVTSRMTQEQLESFWLIREQNNRLNPARQKLGRNFNVQELQGMTNDSLVREAIVLAEPVTKEISEIQIATGEHLGRAFKRRVPVATTPTPPEGAIALPSGSVAVNELEQILKTAGYQLKDINKILAKLQKETPTGFQVGGDTQLRFTNVPDVALKLEKELPKYGKVKEFTPEGKPILEEVTKPTVEPVVKIEIGKDEAVHWTDKDSLQAILDNEFETGSFSTSSDLPFDKANKRPFGIVLKIDKLKKLGFKSSKESPDIGTTPLEKQFELAEGEPFDLVTNVDHFVVRNETNKKSLEVFFRKNGFPKEDVRIIGEPLFKHVTDIPVVEPKVTLVSEEVAKRLEKAPKSKIERPTVFIKEEIVPMETGVFAPHVRTVEATRELIEEGPNLEKRIAEIMVTNKEVRGIKDPVIKEARARQLAQKEIGRLIGPSAGRLREKFYTNIGDALADDIEIDPVKAYEAFIRREATVSAQLKNLGSDNIYNRTNPTTEELANDNLTNLLDELEKEMVAKKLVGGPKIGAKEAGMVKELIKDNINTFLHGAHFNDLISMTRKVQGFKLGLAAINNMTQSLNNLLKAELPYVYAGFKSAFGKLGGDLAKILEKEGITTGKELTQKAGLTRASILEDVLREEERGLLNSALNTYLKVFKWTEQGLNRPVAANTAGHLAIGLQRTINTAKNPKQIARAFQRLEDLIGRKIDLTEGKVVLEAKDILRAANRFTKETQFGINPLENPWWANTEAGSLAFQFKTFIYQQTRLIFNATVGELQAGNPGMATRNFAILATIYPMSGSVIGSLRNIITGQENNYDLWTIEGYLNSIAQPAGLGVFQDILESALRSPQGLLNFFAGPTAGSLSGIGYNAVKALKDLSDGEIPLEEAEATLRQIFGAAARIPGRILEEF